MTATLKLLEKWKAAMDITSDNAAAIELGLGRQAVSRWRTEGRNAEAATVARMARDIKQDPAAWIFAVESEKAQKDAASARELIALARRFGYAALLVLMSIPSGQLSIM